MLTMLQVRKAYMAVPVIYDGKPIRAQRLNGDSRLREIFLQSVVGMSRKSYDRRLLSMAIKFGNPRPSEHDALADLARALNDYEMAIGYMWRSDAEARTDVQIIKVLWRED